MKEQLLSGFDETVIEQVRHMDIHGRTLRAIKLLREHEPEDGYYVAFSGGKDSCVIKELVRMARVKHECWYNQTTIDPPELVRFIKQHHADVRWNIPKHGNMMARIAYMGMPTRFARWCCKEYKETGGHGRVCVFGVRAAESRGRTLRWRELSESFGRTVVCPIVYWSDDHVWEFLSAYSVPYCKLYDEGQSRLGCVGCPLKNRREREADFALYPKFGRNWKEAARKYWESKQGARGRNGKPHFAARFTFDEFWEWWMSEKTPDPFREDCQQGLLWTNQPGDEE